MESVIIYTDVNLKEDETLKITATLNVQNKSYSGVKKHVEHDKNLKHSNKDIDFNKSKFNQSDILISDNELNEIKANRYKESFEKHNYSQKKSGHKSRMYDDVLSFVNSKEKTTPFDKSTIATFGNKDNQDALLDNKNEMEVDKILTAESNGLSEYAHSFNKRNKYLKIARYTTNVDESTPHIHMQLITLGKTKKGKPSMSLNAALKDEYQHKTGKNIKDTRQALSWFREQEDTALVHSMSNNINLDYELTRTKEHIEDFDGYKKVKESLDQKEKLIKQQQINLKEDKKQVLEYKIETTDLIKSVEPDHKMEPYKKDMVPNEVKTEEGYEQHVHAPFKNLFTSAIKLIKDTAEKEFNMIKNFNKKMKKFATEFYKIHTNIQDNNIDKLTNFNHPNISYIDKNGKNNKITTFDFLLKSMKSRNEQMNSREKSLDEREKSLKNYETDLNKRDSDLLNQFESLNEYKEKLTAKEISNSNFEQAKETENISPDLMDEFNKKLKKAEKIKKQKEQKEYKQKLERKRNIKHNRGMRF